LPEVSVMFLSHHVSTGCVAFQVNCQCWGTNQFRKRMSGKCWSVSANLWVVQWDDLI